MSTFILTLRVPRTLVIEGEAQEREFFYDWLWAFFGDEGLLGVHEGTMLSDEAAEKGFETEAWVIDAAQAPENRDWIGDQELEQAQLYFGSLENAESAKTELSKINELKILGIEEQQPKDWDAEWKKSFLSSPDGIRIKPYWRIMPPWIEGQKNPDKFEKILRINPGAGFGTGTHETTQVCLEIMAEENRTRGFDRCRVLDFGSGSGILAIGAAMLGAQVDAVEIDPLAIENARHNAEMNGVEGKIAFSPHMKSSDVQYDVVIANIIREVLLRFAEELVARMKPGATLIHSGLMEMDLADMLEKYQLLLPGYRPEVRRNGDWRGIWWKLTS